MIKKSDLLRQNCTRAKFGNRLTDWSEGAEITCGPRDLDDGLQLIEVPLAMSYTIVSDVCEGCGDCIPVCPEECIFWEESKLNRRGLRYVYIDDNRCTNCTACLSVCPIEGAVLDEWKPMLQRR